jgi:hypothetical protein
MGIVMGIETVYRMDGVMAFTQATKKGGDNSNKDEGQQHC